MKRAAEWVRAGGHAIVWIAPRKARLVFAKPKEGDEHDLGWWSVLDLGRYDYEVMLRGPLTGLALIRVPHDCYAIVRDRTARDSIHEGPTRTIELDCLECGACCHDANVILDEDDFARWRDAGRKDLFNKAYLKRKDGRVTLRFLETGNCRNLGADLKCGIYEVRPDNCRAFVVGSECCLAAREDTLSLRDGLPTVDDEPSV